MKTITTTFKVPVQHPCFPGHFPGNPIVPGALLMQWILQSLREQLSGIVITGISSIKFTDSLKPGDSCELEVHYDAANEKARLSCQSATGTICKAVVLLHSPGEIS